VGGSSRPKVLKLFALLVQKYKTDKIQIRTPEWEGAAGPRYSNYLLY
jgi:hypothetical protein